MGTTKAKRKLPNRKVAIEISRSELSMVVLQRRHGDVCEVRGHHLAWQQQAASLNTDDGVRELTAALTMLVSKEKLAGASVNVALSSDFAVTRVVAGETETVRAELRNLRERSTHYLSLGAGAKAVAESHRPIDAKQIQAWLTVTNEKTLYNVVRAVDQAGLKVELIEHALVAMCRAVGKMGRDADSPVIILEINQRGVGLGISYRGQLLFDYRPGGMDSKEHIAEIVDRHLERFQRYCNRYFRFATGKISQVFLSGERDELDRVRDQFAGSGELSAEILDPKAVGPDWEYDDSFAADVTFLVPLGSALVEEELQQSPDQRPLPNLMDYFHSAWREPLLPTLLRVAWPVAATLLLALSIFAAAFYQQRQAIAVERGRQALDAELGRVRTMKLETEAANLKIGYLQRIQAGLTSPPWHDLITMIGHCLPERVWLDSVRIEQDASVSIEGTSETEDLVFEFLRYLKRVPSLENVNLEGQQPVRLSRGPAVRFDVKCRFSDRTDYSEKATSDD